MTMLGVAAIGLVIGFLGGLFGKGGSAIATPLLHAIGIPAIIAVAAPLPATIPSTATAGSVYWRARLIDWRVVRWSIAFGVPATAAGALATRWIDGGVLVKVTDVVLIGLGLRFLLSGRRQKSDVELPVRDSNALLAGVAVTVGLASGLLANSGGFLLAPLFVAVLRLPIKAAFASSLAVAAVLAIPGTIVHASLGHINWTIVAVFASTSVPLSFLGARVALRTDPKRLERVYGVALTVLGTVFLFLH
ncbi:MAG: sulfite exporter TauE/SafE family protein [Ilumatobacteraceae bacterium]